MRESHAECVKISRGVGGPHLNFFGFRPKTHLAWPLLKSKKNRVDSVKDFPRVHGLSAKTKLKPGKSNEEITEENRGFHSHRVVSRYCHHRYLGRHAAACARSRQGPRATHQLHQQPQTDRVGLPDLRN